MDAVQTRIEDIKATLLSEAKRLQWQGFVALAMSTPVKTGGDKDEVVSPNVAMITVPPKDAVRRLRSAPQELVDSESPWPTIKAMMIIGPEQTLYYGPVVDLKMIVESAMAMAISRVPVS